MPKPNTLSEIMPQTIKLLLVDDHPVVRRGIAACLARYPNFVIVGEASDGGEALRKASQLKPDVILMDVDMPEVSGLAATEALRKDLPGTKVLILSMHQQAEGVMRIIQSGARGYVLKEANPDDLARAIEAVYQGELFFSPDVARVALNQFVGRKENGADGIGQITSREKEVLIAIADGLSNKEIACRLGVGVRTVETHRERIMRKLNIHSVAGLTKYALSKGLIVLHPQPDLAMAR